MKVLAITCYFDPDYVRSRSLRAALQANPAVDMTILKNTYTGVLRYVEVGWKLMYAKLFIKPDVYILMFRGQEILPLVLLVAGNKPVLFDEFIVPLAWATDEGHRASPRVLLFRLLAKWSAPVYAALLKHCRFVLSDTLQHAQISAQLSGLDLKRYKPLPVGTDETLFKPAEVPIDRLPQVFFYGSKMTPLHGLPIILEAAEYVARSCPEVFFVISGGDRTTRQMVDAAVRRGAHITYTSWTPFNELPAVMQKSLLCLGGPFGNTPQAERVITGKTYQALACAVPTVVGNTAATAELTHRLDCLKVSLGDAAALAAEIEWAYTHPAELKKIGLSARKVYDKHYSHQEITRLLMAILQEM